MTTVFLIGEDNPYGALPEYALYYLPERASGWNLMTKVLGLSVESYMRLDRRNLCAGGWSMKQARESVARLLRPETPGVVVMLGRKVATAFNYTAEFFTWQHACPGHTLVSIPHPSGLSRAWNDPAAGQRARAILREHAPDVPWGEEVR